MEKNAEGVVHVDLETARSGDALLFGDLYSFFYGVIHPDFGNYNHEGETDRPRVGGGVMDAVVDEVGS